MLLFGEDGTATSEPKHAQGMTSNLKMGEKLLSPTSAKAFIISDKSMNIIVRNRPHSAPQGRAALFSFFSATNPEINAEEYTAKKHKGMTNL